jgi:hypothetical protein
MKAIGFLLCVSFTMLGCNKSEPPPPIATVSAAPVTSVAPVASAPAPVAEADSAAAPPPAASAAAAAKAIPTPADFEVQATTAITPANAAQVLTAIDKEVGK